MGHTVAAFIGKSKCQHPASVPQGSIDCDTSACRGFVELVIKCFVPRAVNGCAARYGNTLAQQYCSAAQCSVDPGSCKLSLDVKITQSVTISQCGTGVDSELIAVTPHNASQVLPLGFWRIDRCHSGAVFGMAFVQEVTGKSTVKTFLQRGLKGEIHFAE